MTQRQASSVHSRLSGRAARTCSIVLMMAGIGLATMAPETFGFPAAPTTLSYSASTGNPVPAAQTVTFSKNSLLPRPWTSTGDVAWITVSPSSGTISREQEQISVQVNATGLPAGTYSGNVRIAITDKNGRTQVTSVAVTLVVSGGTTTPAPSIMLNPTSLTFSGTAGGIAPLAKTINLTNPTGGTLTWALTESAAWLGLNLMSGTTTTEVDSISASVSTTGLAAGTYNTVISVTASGAVNSPQTIPVMLTLSPPTTTGTTTLTWTANTETDLAGYRIYVGTQPGVYGTPVFVGNTTSYTVGNLPGGKTYYFSVTASDNAGNESPHSAEVSKTIF